MSSLMNSICHLSSPRKRSTAGGIAVYNSWTLSLVYDWLALGCYLGYAWRCPCHIIQELYNNVLIKLNDKPSSSLSDDKPAILEVGVGTGFFPAQAPLPPRSKLVLFDLNQACLAAASARCREAHRGKDINIQTLRGDFLAPVSDDNSIHRLVPPGEMFDVVFANMLLHCLPGPPSHKAAALIRLAQLIKPSTGILAGVTILGWKDGRHNLFGQFLMAWHNGMRWFGNADDEVMSFIGPLRGAFESVEWRVVGSVLVWTARGPKRLYSHPEELDGVW